MTKSFRHFCTFSTGDKVPPQIVICRIFIGIFYLQYVDKNLRWCYFIFSAKNVLENVKMSKLQVLVIFSKFWGLEFSLDIIENQSNFAQIFPFLHISFTKKNEKKWNCLIFSPKNLPENTKDV